MVWLKVLIHPQGTDQNEAAGPEPNSRHHDRDHTGGGGEDKGESIRQRAESSKEGILADHR